MMRQHALPRIAEVFVFPTVLPFATTEKHLNGLICSDSRDFTDVACRHRVDSRNPAAAWRVDGFFCRLTTASVKDAHAVFRVDVLGNQ